MTARDQFLQRVRQAVAHGNRAQPCPELPQRGTTGYQGAGADPVARFCAELTTAGGKPHPVTDREEVETYIASVLREKRAKRILLGVGRVIDALDLRPWLRSLDCDVVQHADYPPGSPTAKEQLFAADLAVTGVDYLIAETGSLVYLTRPDEPRSFSLLPPVHIVVADESQLLPDLFDLFERVPRPPDAIPSALTLITGPSKTGDIELKLVTGVHGPGEVHVVLLRQ